MNHMPREPPSTNPRLNKEQEKQFNEAVRQSHDPWSWMTRLQGVQLLGNFPHQHTIPHLARALEDSDKDVRLQAAATLGDIAHPDAIPPLVKALKDDWVGYGAARALIRIATRLRQEGNTDKRATALYPILLHLRMNEKGTVIRKAFSGAAKGKVTEKNAGLYFKQLRALEGKLK